MRYFFISGFCLLWSIASWAAQLDAMGWIQLPDYLAQETVDEVLRPENIPIILANARLPSTDWKLEEQSIALGDDQETQFLMRFLNPNSRGSEKKGWKNRIKGVLRPDAIFKGKIHPVSGTCPDSTRGYHFWVDLSDSNQVVRSLVKGVRVHYCPASPTSEEMSQGQYTLTLAAEVLTGPLSRAASEEDGVALAQEVVSILRNSTHEILEFKQVEMIHKVHAEEKSD